MPLPTIEKTGYREEPLILNEHIELIKSKFRVLKDYYPFIENEDDKNIDFKDMNDYLKCIRSLILQVKK